MIDITPLVQTGMDKSKNPSLITIWTMVGVYNSLATGLPEGSVPADARRSALEPQLALALRFVATWITSKPPKRTLTNQARWDALRQLSENIGAEAKQLGIRFLTTPADMKTISAAKRSYWLEYLDPHHRPGYILSEDFGKWLVSGTRSSFWDWLGAPAAGAQKVQYLKGTAAALNYRVVFGGTGQAVSLDPTRPFPFTTNGLSTVFSGNGWGIFVADSQNNLYIHKHVEGDFHHSSFLSGEAVTAAGEIAVNEQGWVSVITAKSGHYMPSVADMQRLVHNFPMIPGNCIIRPDFGDTQGGKPAKVYSVDDFRTDGTNAPTLDRHTVSNRVPSFARTMEADRWINRVPV